MKDYAPQHTHPPQPLADLQLSHNEGRPPTGPLGGSVSSRVVARYPDLSTLGDTLAARLSVSPDRLLVTAGGDDALLRVCLATLGHGGEALIAEPTFEMIPRYVRMAGGTLRSIDWPEGAFPTDDFLAAIRPNTRIVFLVSPNNPTGAVASHDDLERIALALPETLLVLDAAYAEYADEDLTAAALQHDNVVVVRTLSKAWGLAGLRVGYALGSPEWIERLRAAGNPYPVSIASAAIALERLSTGEGDMRESVRVTREQSRMLIAALDKIGVRCSAPSQANFVLLRGINAAWVQAAMESLGIAIRRFPDNPSLTDAIRVSMPGTPQAFARLLAALHTVLSPQALLFDLDGVLADVSGSYRVAIQQTAASLGLVLSTADIERAKAQPGANDDWVVTHRLLAERGVEVSLAEVTSRFEGLYQGIEGKQGLKDREVPCAPTALLTAWAKRYSLAVVTGRPRADALEFLRRYQLQDLFKAIVCREDTTLKPSPDPVLLALKLLSCERAWMLGDTPDDLVAARTAGVVPIGVIPPGGNEENAARALSANGAAHILRQTADLKELL
ncbi:MAG: histidinol-phosphate aminotransferase [Planctomycetota bacterium]